MNKAEKELNKKLKNESILLKKYNLLNTNANISLKKTGKYSIGAFLWQQELVSEYKLYISYLGFIDAMILEKDRDIAFQKEFIDYNNEISKLENEKKELILKRNGLLRIINDSSNIMTRFDCIKEVLETIPSFTKFEKLYEDLKTNEYQLDLQAEFINAYNYGLILFGRVNRLNFDRYFNKYTNDLCLYKEQNKEKIKEIDKDLMFKNFNR